MLSPDTWPTEDEALEERRRRPHTRHDDDASSQSDDTRSPAPIAVVETRDGVDEHRVARHDVAAFRGDELEAGDS